MSSSKIAISFQECYQSVVNFEKLTDSVIVLDFEPRTELFPADVALVVNNYQISGFAANMGLFYAGDLGQFFSAAYKEIGLGERARLLKAVSSLENFEELWKELSPQAHLQEPTALKALSVLHELPKAFQDWVDDKKMSLNELHPLCLWHINGKPTDELSLLADDIVKWNCSHQEGALALEYAIDLYLMGNMSSFHISAGTKKDWISEIKSRRYPQTSQRDEEESQRVKTAPWPQRVQGRAFRQGDSSNIEIKLNIQSERDLDQALSQLTKNKEELCQHLWPRQ